MNSSRAVMSSVTKWRTCMWNFSSKLDTMACIMQEESLVNPRFDIQRTVLETVQQRFLPLLILLGWIASVNPFSRVWTLDFTHVFLTWPPWMWRFGRCQFLYHFCGVSKVACRLFYLKRENLGYRWVFLPGDQPELLNYRSSLKKSTIK